MLNLAITHKLTDTVTYYISFCEDVCVPSKTLCTYNNTKPWFTARLRQFCAEEEAYRSGDRAPFNQVRKSLTEEIRVDKRSYTEKLKSRFPANDPASVWKGLPNCTNYGRIIPEILSSKLSQLTVSPTICQWIISFLTGRKQQMRLGKSLLIYGQSTLGAEHVLDCGDDSGL